MKTICSPATLLVAIVMSLLTLAGGSTAHAAVTTTPETSIGQPSSGGARIQAQRQSDTIAIKVQKKVRISCASGRCTIKLTNQETRDLGAGRIKPLALPHPALTVAYNASAVAHRYFAWSYGNRGWCSQFVLSIYPWESQGYMRAAC